jgi:hypothetical protein
VAHTSPQSTGLGSLVASVFDWFSGEGGAGGQGGEGGGMNDNDSLQGGGAADEDVYEEEWEMGVEGEGEGGGWGVEQCAGGSAGRACRVRRRALRHLAEANEFEEFVGFKENGLIFKSMVTEVLKPELNPELNPDE